MKNDIVIAVRTALVREKESYDLYQRLMTEARSEHLQILFRKLAIEELKHEALLRECLQGGDLAEAKARMEGRTEDFSLPHQVRAPAESRELIEGMELAIRKEQAAVSLYLRMKGAAADPDLQQVFMFLVHEEEHHARALAREYGKLV
jgi:rubrerythrin